jgi:hypothetical protein
MGGMVSGLEDLVLACARIKFSRPETHFPLSLHFSFLI